MGPTLKSVLYKGDFSMYLDIILVPYFRLSSIFSLLSLLYTPLLFSLSLNTDRLRYTDADYAYGAHFDVFLTFSDYAISISTFFYLFFS